VHFNVLDSNDSATELSKDELAVAVSESTVVKYCREDCGDTKTVLSPVLLLLLIGDSSSGATDSFKDTSSGLADFPTAGHEEVLVRFGEKLRGRDSNDRKKDDALSKFLRSDCFVKRVDSAEARPVGGFWADVEIPAVRLDDELHVD